MSEVIDRQTAFSGTKEVSEKFRFDEARLASYLVQHIEGFKGELFVKQFKGGQSNPTYILETPTAKYVLRRKPPGKLLPSAHAVDREYRVMRALGEAGFPVPKALHLCEDDDIIGTMFYVMSFEQGRIIWYVDAPDLEREERTNVFDSMNKTMADLHNYNPETIGLTDFGRPENYVARQIARWTKQYQLSETENITPMNTLIDWLPEHVPAQQATRIVHGDFRLDNVILHTDKPDVLAVLDWELSTLGDPIADFTYHCMQWVMPENKSGAGTGSLLGLNLHEQGIPTLDDYIKAYEKRTGLQVGAHLDFYFAYNFFRLAAILQGIIGRVRDGTSSNPNAAAMAKLVLPLAENGWHYAQKCKN